MKVLCKKKEVLLAILTSLLIISFLSYLNVKEIFLEGKTEVSQKIGPYSKNLSELSLTEVENHIKYFSNQTSRVTGYLGCNFSADYIFNFFNNVLGIRTLVEEYDVLVPYDEGSFIEVESSHMRMNAYALWPNFVQCSPTTWNGIKGHLIYVGKGNLNDFDGKDVEGSIVLMDYNSGDNWLNAAKLGANAVVYVGTNYSTRFQSMSKFLLTPIYFPRVYVSKEDGEKLIMFSVNSTFATLHVNMHYKLVKAKNIIGVINGTKYPSEIIVVSAHYDSWSPIPTLSPGADEATGVSILLELARVFSKNPPERTIWFVALSGHWQAAAGARYFVEKRLFSQEVGKNEMRFLTLVNLDLSSVEPDVELLYVGHLYKYGAGGDSAAIQTRYLWLSKIVSSVQQDMNDTGISSNMLTNNLKYLNWWGTQSEPYILDSEPAAISGLPAFSMITEQRKSLVQETPFDTFENVNFNNTKIQMMISYLLLNELARASVNIDWASIKPTRLRLWSGGTSGFITLVGKVQTLNLTTGWYTSVPGAIVRIGIMPEANNYPFANILTFSDNNGHFTVYGVPPSPVLPGSVFSEAWYLDSYGRILYAPDLGIYGVKAVTSSVTPLSQPQEITTVVFPCGSVELFDIVDPTFMRRTTIPEPTKSGELVYYQEIGLVLPYDFQTFAEPVSYGSYYRGREPVAMVFMPPKSKFTVVLQAGELKARVLGIITNSSEIYPEGQGLSLYEQGDRIRITKTALTIANDMYLISNKRYETLKEHFVSKRDAEEYLENADAYINLAKKYFGSKNYSEAYDLSYIAWSCATVAYDKVIMPIIYDLSATTILFFFLLIPFSVFFERLIFHVEGKKRLLATFIPPGFLLVVFYFIHPSLAVVSSSILTLAGIVIVVFLAIILWIFLGEVSKTIELEAIKRKGAHKYFVATFAPATVFASVAIDTMRKQKLRSILTFMVIITVSIAITSFTSSSAELAIKLSSSPQKSFYNGILIKNLYAAPPKQPLDFTTINVVEGIVKEKGVVLPRLWYYPPSVLPLGVSASVVYGPRNITVRAISGLTPEELKLNFGNLLLRGRVFSDEDVYSCILTLDQATKLGVKEGDTVELMGMKLTIVGILANSSVISNTLGKDLDGLTPTPLDPETLAQYRLRGGQVPAPAPLGWSSVFIVPFRLVKDLGGYVASISVQFRKDINKNEATEIAQKIASLLDIPVYLGFNGEVTTSSKTKSFLLLGWDVITVLVAIAFLNILIALLNLTKMKEKEMYIYSALGLPPSGSITIFVVEAMIYAVISVTVGYLGGFALSEFPLVLGIKILPPTYIFNYSSFAVALSALAIILLILGSSIYPILKASKMITPSLERKWTPPTAPRGDLWEFPLPITLKTREEALGLIKYLREYFEGEGRSVAAFSVSEIGRISFEEQTLEILILLAPREMHITQTVRIQVRKIEENQFMPYISIRRLSGVYELWKSNNYAFIDALRKQTLVWSSLPSEERKKYISGLPKEV
jgi:ABC-type antimicrobial peptide transport system permease subunit